MKKGFLFTIHAYAGLLSGIFILAMSISGSLLVFHEELDELQIPSIIKDNTKQQLPIDSSYYLLQKKYPHAQISNVLLAENESKPITYTVYDSSYKKGAQSMQVFMHPQSGDIIKTRGGSKDISGNFMGWLSSFHSSFKLQKKGEWLLGVFGMVFLVSLLTGTIMYRKSIADVLFFRKRIYQKNNLHQILGVYALLFNLMITITGVWMQRYVFTKDFYQEQTMSTPIIHPSPTLFFSIDSALIVAKKQYPDFTGHVIYFAQKRSRKTAVYGSQQTNAFIHSKKLADVLFLDSTGAIVKTAFVNQIAKENKYDIINAQIHYGKYGGMPIKILYLLFGLSGGILSVSGFVLWRKRKKTIISSN